MNHRRFILFPSLIAAAAFALTIAPARAQTTSTARPKTASPAQTYAVPRTPDGQPDLEGVWNSSSITPLERPKELGNKEYYTAEDLAAIQKKRIEELNRDRRDGSTLADLNRAYNEGWYDKGNQFASNHRTSRVIDPPDGRIPPMTPAAQKKFQADHESFAVHPADGPEDRPLPDRCLMFSQAGPPYLPGNYNNNYQIVQTPGYVAILSEMPHQTRIIPLGDRPRLPQEVTQWEGDSRGHWESNTLMVETTNFRFNNRSRFGVQYDGMTDENLRVTEWFTRIGPNTIIYRAKIDDPSVYTKSWTIETPMERATEPIYEYACHEGNCGLRGILAGARADEKAAEQKSGKH